MPDAASGCTYTVTGADSLGPTGCSVELVDGTLGIVSPSPSLGVQIQLPGDESGTYTNSANVKMATIGWLGASTDWRVVWNESGQPNAGSFTLNITVGAEVGSGVTGMYPVHGSLDATMVGCLNDTTAPCPSTMASGNALLHVTF